jgi:hypothetical protein
MAATRAAALRATRARRAHAQARTRTGRFTTHPARTAAQARAAIPARTAALGGATRIRLPQRG